MLVSKGSEGGEPFVRVRTRRIPCHEHVNDWMLYTTAEGSTYVFTRKILQMKQK